MSDEKAAANDGSMSEGDWGTEQSEPQVIRNDQYTVPANEGDFIRGEDSPSIESPTESSGENEA